VFVSCVYLRGTRDEWPDVAPKSFTHTRDGCAVLLLFADRDSGLVLDLFSGMARGGVVNLLLLRLLEKPAARIVATLGLPDVVVNTPRLQMIQNTPEVRLVLTEVFGRADSSSGEFIAHNQMNRCRAGISRGTGHGQRLRRSVGVVEEIVFIRPRLAVFATLYTNAHDCEFLFAGIELPFGEQQARGDIDRPDRYTV